MFNSTALDVVIGIVFIYLLYSLLVTIIGEIIATWLGLRARILRKSIERMLVDDSKSKELKNSTLKWIATKYRDLVYKPGIWYKGSLAEKFYQYPSIKYLGQSSFFKLPSYISAANFSAVVLTLLKQKGTSATLMGEIKNGLSLPQLGASPETRKLLNDMIAKADGDLDKFQKLLEAWFDETMERTSGWYKRNLRLILFSIGFLIAIILNVNTFNIVKILSSNTPARNAMIKMATDPATLNNYKEIIDSSKKSQFSGDTTTRKFYEQAFNSVKKDGDEASQILGSGWELPRKSTEVELKDSVAIKGFLNALKGQDLSKRIVISPKAIAFISEFQKSKGEELTDISVLIIVRNTQQELVVLGKRDGWFWEDTWFILKSTFTSWHNLFGFLITALALSLGAPFWFDLLNKLIAIRGSGKTTEESTKASTPVKAETTVDNKLKAPNGHDLTPETLADRILYVIVMNEAMLKSIPGVISVNKDYKLESGKKVACIEVNYRETCKAEDIPDKVSAELKGEKYEVPVEKRPLGHAVPYNGENINAINEIRIANKYDEKTNWGTLSGTVKDSSTGSTYLLSCSHVLKGNNTDNKINGITEVVNDKGIVVGKLRYSFQSNFFDIAWAEIEDKKSFLEMKYQIASPRKITVADADALLPIQIVGSKSGIQTGVLWNNSFTDFVAYTDGSIQMFNLLKLTSIDSNGEMRSLSKGGDSGAMLRDMKGTPIGIVIAGNNQFTYAISFDNIFTQFDDIKPFN